MPMIDRGVGREPRHRLADDAEREQRVVEQAVALQDGDPGIDADQERGPERQDHRITRTGCSAPRRARDGVGDRIADQQQDQRRERRDLQAREIGREIERIRAEQRVVVERQPGDEVLQALPAGGKIEHRRVGRLRDHGLRQADLEHDQERHEEEHGEPERRTSTTTSRCPDRSAGSALLDDRAHRVSTTPASGGQLSQTRSSAADRPLDQPRAVRRPSPS